MEGTQIFTITFMIKFSPELSAQIDRLIEALGPGPDTSALEAATLQLEGKTGDLQAAVDRNLPQT